MLCGARCATVVTVAARRPGVGREGAFQVTTGTPSRRLAPPPPLPPSPTPQLHSNVAGIDFGAVGALRRAVFRLMCSHVVSSGQERRDVVAVTAVDS